MFSARAQGIHHLHPMTGEPGSSEHSDQTASADGEPEGNAAMRVVTRFRKQTAIVLVAGAIAMLTAGCFADTAPGEPSDPNAASLFRWINYDRANNGLPALQYGPKLTNQAGTWSWQMAQDNSLHHQDLNALINSPDYANYHSLGENIAVVPGNYSMMDIEYMWMHSDAHRANILNPNFNVVGVGVYRGSDGRWWATADFGSV
jgi:uncharacterized protein YkwD